MDPIFKVSVNNSFDFDISTKLVSELDLIPTRTGHGHLLYNNRSYSVEITEAHTNHKIYKVKLNNNTYNIHINNELDVLIKSMGFEIGSSKKVNSITAPMPGLILDIHVKPGDEVKENDALLILEAMKMENIISAPRDGIIKSVSIKKGDAVDKNELLIAFE